MTIKECYDNYIFKTNGNTLTDALFLNNFLGKIQEYPFLVSDDMIVKIEKKLVFEHGSREVIFDEDTYIFSNIKDTVQNLIDTNRYKYDKLFNLLSLEYNPIENYNSTETEKTKNVADLKETRDLTNTDGGTVANVGNNTQGAEVENKEDIEMVAPFDDSNFHNKTKNTSNTNKNAVTNNDSNTETRNLTSKDTGTVLNANTENVERELKRSGNIGITTNQQMILSELDLATLFNFYKIIVTDIANYIALGVF